MSKILGVLGGMGPAATVAFLARVQALTPARGDADHIRVVMDMNPQVPDRNTRPGEAEAELAAMALRLKAAGAQVLAMPCNTAHAQKAGIVAAGLPFIDMIAATVAAVGGHDARAVGILATPGGEALYRPALEAEGIKPVLLQGGDREAFMACVYGVKRGDTGAANRAEMARLAQALTVAGADAIIAGCTEVPLLLDASDVSVPLVDSAEVLAGACVEACLSDD
ncbi:aspartate/glutamate racemase family protein [Brevundimonas subvibrioides]|uniref:Aspartate racemase n=1 Tax=Brevundimonas subvibrioides (strain ATCC 15264 / DSM 4735 / LMG 14903 / NBRC 16000 / CB 81) TaxID=633149 RepID=D9QFJ2_BRESC|nr:amino acid racemase [Brevundimonas subvibrioides]ADL02507.1 aspartate racemase [Brevundimonas subvibrioides ATCC 15264]